MTRKLYAYIQGECAAESPDDISMQEASLGGHTFLQYVKEQLQDSLESMRGNILIKQKELGDKYKISQGN